MKFPKHFKAGSTRTTIYRIPHSRTKAGFVYSVAWYDSTGDRKQKQFTKLEKAVEMARLKADQIAAGMIGAAEASREDLEAMRRAQELCGDVPLMAAVEEWAKARELTGGPILEACRQYRERGAPSFKRITVSDAVAKFKASKIRLGIECKIYYPLDRFADHYGAMALDSISTDRLNIYLGEIDGQAITRNTHRRRLVTLFRWARKNRFLPRDVTPAAEDTERMEEEDIEIETLDPTRFEALLKWTEKKHPQKLPIFALAGLCGLRRSEVQGQSWDDVEIERGFVRVTTAKRGTPARRLAPLGKAAAYWLAKVAKPTGPVCEDKRAIIDLRSATAKAGFVLPTNVLRNSFISNQVALTGNIERTALQAGNSAKIIRKHYLELVTREDSTAWFSIGLITSTKAP